MTVPDDVPWDKANRAAWLHARLGQPERQRRDMVAALRARLTELVPVLGSAAIDRALAAMAEVPREAFVCPIIAHLAYLPMALAIGLEQTISHPEMVAILAAAIAPPCARVLDVGTGSGYQAAVLAHLAGHVTSVEIIPAHAELAARRLARAGIANVEIRVSDAGASGLFPARAFDAIVMAAGASCPPPALLAALDIGGHLVMPLGETQDSEHLVRFERVSAAEIRQTTLVPTRFVPLTGVAGRNERDH